MGEFLSRQGHSVLGIRLAGHATRLEDMRRSRWQDWLASVEDGWHLLSGCSSQIFVMGLSMGGVLSLLFASRFPVAGVVAMSTPHHLPNDPRLKIIKPLSLVMPTRPKGPPDWHDQEAYQQHRHYEEDPTRSYGELKELVAEMQSALPLVTMPALLIYSKNDSVVTPQERHMELLLAALGSQVKQTMWVEGSGHVITEDAARQQVFQAAGEFIHRVVNAQP